MPDTTQRVSVRLTQAQRKAVAEIVPELADRLKLDEKPQRAIQFTLPELKGIQRRAAADAPKASTGMKRHSLRHVAEITALAVDRSKGIGIRWSLRTAPPATRSARPASSSRYGVLCAPGCSQSRRISSRLSR
jgi:hypothetical protein